MSESSTTSSGGLHEVVLTLPRWVIVSIAIVLLGCAGTSIWLAATSLTESVRDAATSVLPIVLSMLVVVAAAIGIRRTSTTQVDELVTRFLEVTVKSRLELACRHRDVHPFPFDRVDLVKKVMSRSYAGFALRWPGETHANAQVEVKMNVFNFEVVVEQAVQWAGELPASALFDSKNLERVFDHPLLRRIVLTMQGSVAEGYDVRAVFEPKGNGVVLARLSFRQRLREHFLASPFLKRYYAEDAAILIGVLFQELESAKLLAAPTASHA